MITLLFILLQTLIVGQVYDAETKTPVAAANIYYQGTEWGTISNDSGYFLLRAPLEQKKTMVVSAVGYRKQKFEVMPGMQAGVDVALVPKTEFLREVLAMPGENPATYVLKRVRENRTDNGATIETEKNEEQLFEEERIIYLQSKKQEIPVYLSHHDSLHALLSESDFAQFLQLMDGHTNFYHNTVSLFSTAFVSPVASSASTYYRFFLADSIVDTLSQSAYRKLYCIHFRTKNGYYPTFDGEMTIDSTDWSIRHIAVSVPREINRNYLRCLHLEQTFGMGHELTEEVFEAELNISIKSDSSHLLPGLRLSRHRVRRNPSPFHAEKNLHGLQQQPQQQQQQQPQHEYNSVAQTIDSLSQTSIVRAAKWVAAIINTGYIPTVGCIEIGKIAEIIQINHHEGLHLGLPVRTNEKLWKNVSLEAYIAYGIKDNAVKGMGQVAWRLPTDRRNILRFRYEDHYIYSERSWTDRFLTENSIGYGDLDFTSFIFTGLPYSNASARSTAIRDQQFALFAESDWAKGIETTFRLNIGRTSPSYNHALYQPAYDFAPYRYANLQGCVRLGWHERVADLYMQRIHLRGRYPTLFIGAEFGSWAYVNQDYHLYGKLHMTVRQTVELGIAGRLDYAATAGLVLGRVPYPLLEIFDGNQGYMYEPYRFTLMNNHQYAADKYVTLQAEYNGMGVLFNLIPGIRFLHLRELISAKVAYGTNKWDTGNSMRTPYVEVGVGIGNILRVADIYSVWRLTNRNDSSTPVWAIRGRINIGL